MQSVKNIKTINTIKSLTQIDNLANQILINSQIKKSPYNKNKYLYKQLSNGIKYLLVQDEKTDKSSAAFCVNIGSLNDPEEYQGLAHFLEHMVFMGSKTYPGENEYNDFLTKNSGYSNAFTELSMTNYYFESSNDSFLEAFKMTSRFFIDPLLNESSVDREINAVDSEFKNGLRDDDDRLQEIVNKESNIGTAFKKFMCGNLQSLKKPGLLDALKIFFEKYYSADIISVVIYSHFNLDILETKVDEILLEIENKALAKNFSMFNYEYNFNKKKLEFKNRCEEKEIDNKSKNGNNYDNKNIDLLEENVRYYVSNGKYAYDESNLGMLYKYAGIIDKDRLLLEWNFNLPYNHFYKNKPLDFIASLLGTKGSESFILNLIKENLITDGYVYIYNYANTYTKLTIDLDLTEEGFKKYLEVIKRVIKSIEKLKKLPVKKKFYEESKKMAEISFEYHVDDDICNFVSSTARNLLVYEPKDILYGDFIMEEFDQKLINNFFDFLSNKNLNIYLISDSFESLFEGKEYTLPSNISDLEDDLLIKIPNILNRDKMEIDEEDRLISSKVNENQLFVRIKKEEIYDSKYTLEKIDFKKLDLNNFNFLGLDKIGYPSDNHLIPETFEFAVDINEINNKNSKLPPKKIFENDNYSVYYKIDNSFYQPFIYIHGKIYLENLNIKNRDGKIFTTDKVTTYLSLWFDLLDKEIYERNSIANFSTYYFEFYHNFNYIVMKFSGYNDKMKFGEFIHFIFDYFIELHDLNKIQNFKIKILTLIIETIKSLKNMSYDSASSQAAEKFKEISFKKYCKKETSIEILEELKLSILEKEDWKDFVDIVSNYLGSIYINWLAQGHVNEKKALQFIEYISAKLRNKNLIFNLNSSINSDKQIKTIESDLNIDINSNFDVKKFTEENCNSIELIKYSSKSHYYHSFNSIDPKNENSALVTYFLLGKLNDREKCIALILQTMLFDEFFDDLRTQQSLGYTCSLYLSKYSKIDSFVCLVESSVKPPEYITNRITKFIFENDPEDQLDDEDFLEDFKKYKESLILDLTKKDFILGNEVDRNFNEICSREFNFGKNQEWIKIIETTTIDDIINFYQKYFKLEPSRIDIGFISQNMIDENNKTLEKNLTLTYKDIVKNEDENNNSNEKIKNKTDKVNIDEKENDDEEEEEEEEKEGDESVNNESSINIELPKRIRIEDDNFKHTMETYKF